MIFKKIKNRLFRHSTSRKIIYSILDLYKYSIFSISNKIILDFLNTEAMAEKFEILSKIIPSHQKKYEFCRFIDFMRNKNIETIVEIGTADSATHLLLSELLLSKKKMIAVDLELRNRLLLKLFNSNQDLRIGIQGSSHSDKTIQKLSHALGNKQIDLLFIDGDHSYEGVKKDFEIYKSFVSNNGIIAFHDIVPDSFSRTGIKTNSYVGEVPKFWNEIKKNYKYKEFIESDDQDGCGIGIIYFDQT